MYRYVLILMMLASAAAAQDAAAAPAETPAPEKTAAAPAKPKVLAPPRVRTGSVIKAEFTADKPSAGSESPASKKSSSAWAVLTIALDPGRAASIFDYVLSKDGTEYPCLDLAGDGEEFNGAKRNYAEAESKTCRMLFAVPSAEDEYELIFKLASDQESPVKLNVKPPPPPPAPPAEEKKPEDAAKTDEKAPAGSGDEKADESAPAE